MLFDCKLDQADMHGDSPHNVMFGPDICGSTKRTHVILHSFDKGEGLLIKKDIPAETDVFSHLYTLVVRPDNTFEPLLFSYHPLERIQF